MSIALQLQAAENDEVMFAQLLNIISEYDNYVDKAEPLFDLKLKKLEEVCQTIPKNLSAYDRYYQELKTVAEWLVIKREKIQAKLWKKYLEGYPRALSAKDIQMYIQGDNEYVQFSEIMLEVDNIKNKMQSIVKAFEQMGWMISNITKLRIAELQDAVL